jgi:hypothetical protein
MKNIGWKRFCALLLLIISYGQTDCAFSQDDGQTPQMPSSMTISGFAGSGERTLALGPGGSVLVLNKRDGKWVITGEVGGGVYHMMGQEVDISTYRRLEAYGLTDDDAKDFWNRAREANLKWQQEHPRKPDPQEKKKKSTEGWRDVVVDVNPEWKTKFTEATNLAMQNFDQPHGEKAKRALDELVKLSTNPKFSVVEVAACLNNAANILYAQRKYRDAASLYVKAANDCVDIEGIFETTSTMHGNAWKAGRAAKLNDPTEKPFDIDWLQESDVSHRQKYFKK